MPSYPKPSLNSNNTWVQENVFSKGLQSTIPAVDNEDVPNLAQVLSLVLSGNSFQGDYDASSNLFPALNSSGDPIDKGDYWIIAVSGTLGDTPVYDGYTIYALTNVPGQNAANWYIDTSGKTFNPDQFEIVDNEVSIKDGAITTDLLTPENQDGFALTSDGLNKPKYRELKGTDNRISVDINENDITFSAPQDLNGGATPVFVSVELSGTNPNTVLLVDENKQAISSETTAEEISFVHGVESSIQDQLDSKQPVITDGSITLAQMANLAANSIIGNNTGSSAVPLALTPNQVMAMLYPVTTDATTSITLDASKTIVNLTNNAARDVSIPAIVPGKIWTVKDAAFSALTGNITITPTNPILIDGQSTYIMAVNGASVSIYTDGTNLFVM